jgi:hypothetical protein
MEAKDPAQHTAAPTPGHRIIANEVDTIVFRRGRGFPQLIPCRFWSTIRKRSSVECASRSSLVTTSTSPASMVTTSP